ncbi:hypothetical protein J1792_33070 [Streptomyces triculaminicus]|uniref:Uncharacterized protein n=2 Tax=Streptomyces TaxID=1883 RepID=A0A939JQF2_9ACTN|nr:MULTISPECIES: hypothetical protein [Streptomyces]MBO0657371.1 hypothetical protein [Streptomyces triculaminicus]QSY49323.1 hypothetical protein J3S04_31045 [Streptomyces griseocarneus]
MSGALLTALLRVRAAQEGRAQRAARFRHLHIADEPLVVAAYNLAGDPASPLGIVYGTDRERPCFRVAPEPRNRDIRFRLLNTFFSDFVAYVDALPEGDPPQVIAGNQATLDYLFRIGDSVRFLPVGEGVEPETVLGGRHLVRLVERRQRPGAATAVALTRDLAAHWITGQSALEDAALGPLLAWIDPPEGQTGRGAAESAEHTGLPVGPLPKPEWDEKLARLITKFNEARDGATDPKLVSRLGTPVKRMVRDALMESWDDVWRGLDLLVDLPEAPHAQERWAEDSEDWAAWRKYIHVPEARLARKTSARAAVWQLGDREQAQRRVEAQKIVDDPLKFVAAVADGLALSGLVVSADPDRKIVPPGRKNKVSRPLFTLSLERPSPLPLHTEVFWLDRLACQGRIVEMTMSPPRVTIEIAKGTRRTRGEDPTFPRLGREARFTTLDPGQDWRIKLPDADEVWTHSHMVPETQAVADQDSDFVPQLPDGDDA